MTTLLRAELLKLRTTRGWIGYVVALVALTGIATAGTVGTAESGDFGEADFQRDVLLSSIAPLVALLLGITSVTVEWRHGTITRALLATPRRELFVAAKATAALLFGVVLALLATVVVLLVAVPMLYFDDASLTLDGGLVAQITRIVVAAALWGALGAGVGMLLRSQAFALVAAILWIILLEGLLGLLLGLVDLDGVLDYFPGQVLGAFDGSVRGGLSPAVGGLLGLGYVVAFGVLGWLRVERSDIT